MEEHQPNDIATNQIVNQQTPQSDFDPSVTNVRYAENITKEDFNLDVNVDIHSISGERVQARHYEVPVAIEIREGDIPNQEHYLNGHIIVDARPLPWYIRVKLWKFCVLAILAVSSMVVAIVLLTITLSASSSSSSSTSVVESLPKEGPTSFPALTPNVRTNMPTYGLSMKPSIEIDEEYIAMQRGVLEQYYIETDGDNSWLSNEKWLNDDVSVCDWYGCGCNNKENHIVTSFYVQSFKSPQHVPTVLGMLTKLEYLKFDKVNFEGTLPSELFRLHQLKEMILISSLEGALPSEIGNLHALEHLELRENRFDGQIPTELGLLQSLTHLDITDHEYFTEATIPSEIGKLSSLTIINMYHNGLRGKIPTELFGLTSLEQLNLSQNSLSGSLHVSLESALLRELDLSENALTGMIPGALSSLKSLEVLKMQYNKLSSIEPGLLSNGNETLSSHLSTISLHLNKINYLPTNYVRLPLLSHINVDFNSIEGQLPMFQNAAQIDLNANTFTGSIPTEYGLLGNLTRLVLDFNLEITGTVPTELMECDKLSLLSLHNTGISGNITFCDSLGENLVVQVNDVSICGEECECCCKTLFEGI